MFTISRFIEGETPKNVSPKLIKCFAITLAKMHNALSNTVVTINKSQWLSQKNFKSSLDSYDDPLRDSIFELVDSSHNLFNLDLPKTVVHGASWLGNVFASKGKIRAVFDMEGAENTYRILDIARTYLSLNIRNISLENY